MHVVGTAGHVDHGKSTLVERLTGIDPDRFAEEKRRGLTIDLGFAWLTTPSGKEVGIIDVPGHERFIKNMLAGAGGISVCVFVVAANEGWMPQSAEHLAVLDILGIEHGVVALTKSDAVDAATLASVTEEVSEHLVGTALASAEIVACSAKDGTGLDALLAALDRVLETAPRPVDAGRPRLWIDRAFTISGAGTVVTGTLAEGSLQVGDPVIVSPVERAARVRSIQTHKRRVDKAAPGQRVALNLVGVDRSDAHRGRAVVRPHTWRATSSIDALVRVLPADVSGVTHDLREKGAHLLYAGTAETPVRMSLLEGPIRSGDEGLARIWLREPLPLARGDRFVLRDVGRVLTFGGGRVIDPFPSARRPTRPEHIVLLRRLSASTPEEALGALADAEGLLDRADAAARAGIDAIPEDVFVIGDRIASPAWLTAMSGRVLQELERWHREHPLEPGMPREKLRALIDIDPRLFDDLVARIGEVAAQADVVRLSTFAVRLDPDQENKRRRVLEEVDAGAFSPPTRADLRADEGLVRALVDAGDLVAVGDFYLTRARAEEAQARVRAAISESGPMTVAQIRDLLGTTRKYAVPLCEWLDAIGVTRRQGDVRTLATSAR
ncbi:MAG: selenocysteine-specific translation elongation factor [Actinomycetota bacterium]|nr:selenocysteine-specific translation elongation factor [Actinomycetota bacterium]